MGKASRRKGVVKTKSRRSNRGFLVAVVVILVLGVTLIALAKNDNGSSAAKGPGPQVNDHWHAAIGVNLCGTWQANLPLYESATGLHSHGDGFMHMHPFSAAGAGSNANVGLFYKQAGDTVSATEIKAFKQKYKNGDVCDNLDKKPGLVRWSVNGQEKTGNPGRFVPNDRDVVAIAFLPKDVEIGVPPVVTSGTNPSDVSG